MLSALPILVMPMEDPTGRFFSHLQTITPQLKSIFGKAVVSISPTTIKKNPHAKEWLESDPFFKVLVEEAGLPAGEHFARLYRYAAASFSPDTIFHLAYIDRLAFALQSEHRPAFVADIQASVDQSLPLIYARSPRAWDTHPRNYRDLEGMVTRVGELLFGKTVDFCWCHLALTAGQLDRAMEGVTRQDISMVAEIALGLLDCVHSVEVDWLAWEDPFSLGVDAVALKAAREASVEETHKRLAYVIPMLELLRRKSSDAGD